MSGGAAARVAVMLWALNLPGLAQGADQMIEDFSQAPETRWELITDRVMGGQSQGQARLVQIDTGQALRLTGDVSTANNGGFIQARRRLTAPLPASAQGLEIRVRGNGQTYYLHARTKGTVLPWTYYQAAFQVTQDWQTLRIPFAAFEANGRMLRTNLLTQTVTSLALVAYGRDHSADVSISQISLY